MIGVIQIIFNYVHAYTAEESLSKAPGDREKRGEEGSLSERRSTALSAAASTDNAGGEIDGTGEERV